MRVKQKAIPLLLAVLVAVGALCCGVAFRSPRQGVSAAAGSSSSMVDRDRKVANLPKGDTRNLYILSNLRDTPVKLDLTVTDGQNDMPTMVFMYDTAVTFQESKFLTSGSLPFTFPDGRFEYVDFSGLLFSFLFMNADYKYENSPPTSGLHMWFYSSHVQDKKVKSYSSNVCQSYVEGSWGNAIYTLERISLLTETPYIYLEYDVETFWVDFAYLDPSGNGEYLSYGYELPVGSVITDIPEVPNPPHASFKSWDRSFTPVTNDVIYTAQYNYEEFVVEFKDKSNITRKRQTKNFYQKIEPYTISGYSEINGTKKTIYKCIGWTTEKDNPSCAVDLNDMRLDRDLILYPLFEVDKVVDLDAGGNEIPKEETQSWWDKLGAWKLWGWNAGKTAQGLLIVVFIIVGVIAAIYLVKFISWIVDAFATMKMKRDIRKLNREKRRGGY